MASRRCISPRALRDNGGGRLITSEFEPSKAARARKEFDGRGPHRSGRNPRQVHALKTLSANLPETIDLLLLDGAKALYPEILGLVDNRLARRRACRSRTMPTSVRNIWSSALARRRLHLRPLRRGRRAFDAHRLSGRDPPTCHITNSYPPSSRDLIWSRENLEIEIMHGIRNRRHRLGQLGNRRGPHPCGPSGHWPYVNGSSAEERQWTRAPIGIEIFEDRSPKTAYSAKLKFSVFVFG